MASKSSSGRQASLPFRVKGGARRGAGRKRRRGSGVSHAKRARFAKSYPVHVTVRLRDGLKTLRRGEEYAVLRACFEAGGNKGGFRLLHYSVQATHLHLLVEAEDRVALSRGMQGLLVRIARQLNRLWERRGTVFRDRYHEHVLRTPREVRHALAYVLMNGRRHGALPTGLLDLFSSGLRFDGWKQQPTNIAKAPLPVTKPLTWLMKIGWRRHGLISLDEKPG